MTASRVEVSSACHANCATMQIAALHSGPAARYAHAAFVAHGCSHVAYPRH